MKKQIVIELDGSFVLAHRDDDALPVSVIKQDLEQLNIFEINDDSVTSLTLVAEADSFDIKSIERRVAEFIKKTYPEVDPAEVLSVEVTDSERVDDDVCAAAEIGESDTVAATGKTEKADKNGKPDVGGKAEPVAKESESGAKKAEAILDEINGFVGAAEFKALAAEVATVAPSLISSNAADVFLQRSYLFSVGDGCGLSTYLDAFARLIDAVGLVNLHPRPVAETELGAYKENETQALDDAMTRIGNGDRDNVRLLCIDISEWMGHVDSAVFKKLLKRAARHDSEFIYIFRVPFVEKDVLARIAASLNDLLFIKTVSVPPLTRDEITTIAEKDIKGYGFKVAKSAWNGFHERIAAEKSDGAFYGFDTVKKVVRELVYGKRVRCATAKRESTLITQIDTDALLGKRETDGLTGEQMLATLIGNEAIKTKIAEIVAQIEMSLKDGSGEMPCIHMRFTGNPGTGKTTVARIIGKILKERGVLRIGNFYECSGRDLCGRYVGETAPKTASICRDAYGSVLFIDEAYSLYRGDDGGRDYGREAIDTLIAEMENHRSDFVVIMAGYTDDMNTLMGGNAGLLSRMPYTIDFPNFTRDQLFEIFMSMAEARFKCDDGLREAAKQYFDELPDSVIGSKTFGNARFARNLFERTWAKAAMRCQLGGDKKITLTKSDFALAKTEGEFSHEIIPKKARIGFAI